MPAGNTWVVIAMLYNILIHIMLVLNFVATVYCLYELMISVAAFHRPKKAEREPEECRRFAVLIAARNEEAVITPLIESLKMQNYPQDKLDVYVIADNCTDHTAECARKAGAYVYKRFNRVEIGKGYVIRFALEKILAERDIYDAFCVVDADNLVDREFIRSMNRALCGGADVAQGYRDMKNPTDNWVSGCHSLFYWMENRFYNQSRSTMGLSATINGTAFMVSRRYIAQNGFHMRTVTEDLELTMQATMRGYRVEWVPDAKVYDEQPLTVSQSMRQRTRWVRGFMQVVVNYFSEFIRSLVRHPSWVKLDIFMFFISMPMFFIGAGAAVISALLGILCIFPPMGTALNLVVLGLMAVMVFWILGYLTVALENKDIRRLYKAVLAFPIFNVMWLPIYVRCCFRGKVEWKPIVHARNLSIRDVEATQSK